MRDLPRSQPPVPGEPDVADAVARALGQGWSERAPVNTLAEHGVSHLVVERPTGAQRRAVDDVAGLVRRGTSDGVTTWEVRSPVTDGAVPSRGRGMTEDSSVPLRGTGAHADTDGTVEVPRGDELMIAESLDWAKMLKKLNNH